MIRKVPLIVIMGSTASGKTKLSIELAKRFNGEIISADSMQVYKGLSIATAKATTEERSQAVHHMLDITSPSEEFTVKDFRDLALPIIDNLLQSSSIPILVGGTNYYIESILWQILVSSCSTKSKPTKLGMNEQLKGVDKNIKELLERPTLGEDMLGIDSTKLYEYLKVVDPVMASRVHPNNKRRIMRALEVFKDHGMCLSEIIDNQRKLPGASNLGGPRRYEHVIIFWLQCEQETLNERVAKRVDKMVEDGLLEEIRSFYESYVSNSTRVDFEEGILQTIGFKEFIPYLKQYDKNDDQTINDFVISAKTTETPRGWPTLESCLEELKLVTQRYSKKQQKWIRNRFLGNDMRNVPMIYPLYTTDVTRWVELVSEPAINTVQCYINKRAFELEPMPKLKRLGEGFNEETTHHCQTCDRVIIGEYQWHLHMKSNKHKKVKDSKRKKEKLAEEQLCSDKNISA